MLTRKIVFVLAGTIPYPCLLPRPKKAVSSIVMTRAIAREINRISEVFINLKIHISNFKGK